MSKIITPRNHEVILEDEDIIVSKTDLKGRITYANRIFMRISGYNEEESLGHPHNIIRHPDMPRGVYYFMWKTLQAEHEFFGFVKNLCIDGSYYWAFANVTCDYNLDDRVVGYYSVRRKTPDAAKQAVTPLYLMLCWPSFTSKMLWTHTLLNSVQKTLTRHLWRHRRPRRTLAISRLLPT